MANDEENKEKERRERIYVGGLDPSRGLTVELVAARLLAVEDVEILSINDVATSNGNHFQTFKRTGDTRNFFFLDARTTAAGSSELSALDILAKLYHKVKWKGCQIRVERAQPPFLTRLENERRLRVNRLVSVGVLDATTSRSSPTNEEERERGVEQKVVNIRRSLRIRKRFGEEAFHVDTRPRSLEMSHHDRKGWDMFASLHTRMDNKRQTQTRKLFERRKAERKLWASGKGSKRNSEEGDNLNSLSFLNRSIHIRFGDQDYCRDNASEKELQPKAADSEQSGTSSSTSSGTDEASEGTYVWSDDDSANGIDSGEESDEQQKLFDKGDDYTKHNESEIRPTIASGKGGKDIIDGLEYTKGITMDEFSGGLESPREIDLVQTNLKDGDVLTTTGSESPLSDHCLEDDIRSNIDVLSALFPEEHFEKKPLAAPITDGIDDNGTKDSASTGIPNSTSFGAGIIMQRYDPTKESDKGFEVPYTDGKTKTLQGKELIGRDKNEKLSVASGSSDEGSSSSGKVQSNSEAKPSDETGGDESKTISNGGGTIIETKYFHDQAKLKDTVKQAGMQDEVPRNQLPCSSSISCTETEYKKAISAAGEGNDVGSNDSGNGDNICGSANVYEQDKLEGVFKRAKKASESNAGDSAPFSFGFGLSNVAKDDNDPNPPQEFPEKNNEDVEPKSIDAIQFSGTDPPKKQQPKRKRRTGITFPESELSVYEELFFSLNEGPKILKDLDAMKTDNDSQECWQKERLVLTADWKRKQKSASSRKVRSGP